MEASFRRPMPKQADIRKAGDGATSTPRPVADSRPLRAVPDHNDQFRTPRLQDDVSWRLDREFERRGIPLQEAPEWVEDPGLVENLEGELTEIGGADEYIEIIHEIERAAVASTWVSDPAERQRLMRTKEGRGMVASGTREVAVKRIEYEAQKKQMLSDSEVIDQWKEGLDRQKARIQELYDRLDRAFRAKMDDPSSNIVRGETIHIYDAELKDYQEWVVDEVTERGFKLIPTERFGADPQIGDPHRLDRSPSSMARYYRTEREIVLSGLDQYCGPPDLEEQK